MASCPKCSYTLVLLEHRSKYKCALCSKLFPQKEIDDKEFKEWNKRQRILDIEIYNKKVEEEFAQISELKKQIKYLFNGLPKSAKEYRKEYCQKNKEMIKQRYKEWNLKNRDKIRQKRKEYYTKNREKELERCDRYREAHKEQRRLARKLWEEKNKEHREKWEESYIKENRDLDLQKKRINFWRKKQENLADEYFENDGYEACTISF